ncbi:hypothetical protein DPV78_004258 [Talaromyces pinophilus]|nr:hypothetical protein DPV78_004258 [Talaromyces pinophilus]
MRFLYSIYICFLYQSLVSGRDWSSLAIQVDRSTQRTLVDSKGIPFFWQADTAWEIFHRWVNGGWHGPPTVLNTSNAAAFGQYIGQRYAGLPKIIGGDSNRWWFWFKMEHEQPLPGDNPPKIVDSGPVFNELANAIYTAEALVLRKSGLSPFITYHGTSLWISAYPDSTASAMYGDETWLAMDGVQTGHSDSNSTEPYLLFGAEVYQWLPIANQNAVKEMYYRQPTRPVLDLENHYEYWNSSISRNEDGSFRWNSSFVRNGAWHAVYAGSAGVTYGEQAVWQFANPARFSDTTGLNETWFEGIKRPGSGQIKYLRLYVEEHLGIHRTPDDSLLTTESGSDYAEIMAIRDGSWTWATVYAPLGQSFGLDTRYLSGQCELHAWWFVPRNGSYLPLGTIPRSSNLSFTPPTGGTIEDDWVFLVSVLPDGS